MTPLRASMLAGYADCARRAAAKQWRSEIAEAGFELRTLMPSIGASVGTAAHGAVERILQGRLAAPDDPPDVPAAIAHGVGLLRGDVVAGAVWDATTPNLPIAEQQVERLVRSYLPIADRVQPAAVELDLRATIDGWELTGHIDLMTREGRIDDLKTGALPRPHQAQLGAYALLAGANGFTVTSIGVTFIRRLRLSRPQSAPVQRSYDVQIAERTAWGIIAAIRRDVAEFTRSGDPEAFVANPMSLMCSERYCPAWGTSFCGLHEPGEAAEID